MRPLKKLIPVGEALERLLDAVRPIEETEEVALEHAAGRVTAEGVDSPLDVPPFDRAAMDGYAVRAADVADACDDRPVALHCVEALYAGSIATRRVETGTCAEIATGAALPAGADAVVMVECTRPDGDVIEVLAPVRPGQHVTRRAADIAKGEVAVAAGTFLTPARVGALAAVGRARVRVWRRPRVKIGTTGNEVCEPGQVLRPGQIYNINTYSLRVLFESLGCEVEALAVAPDDIDVIRERIVSALDADLVIMTGGSSVGEKDVLQDVLGELGEMLFHGIAVKPGKPTMAARVRGRLVMGMPGYPTSCLSNGYLLLAPVIDRMSHRAPRRDGRVRVPAAEDIQSMADKHHVVTIRLVDGRATRAFKESGVITSMSGADGFIEIPEGVARIAAGQEVEVTLL